MTVRSLLQALTRLTTTVGSLFQALARLWSHQDRDGQRPRLELELLEGRLCPAAILAVLSDPSSLPLTLPTGALQGISTLRRGEHLEFTVTAISTGNTGAAEFVTDGAGDVLAATPAAAQFLTIASSSGVLNVQILVGHTLEFFYTVREPGETFTVTSSDDHEIGAIFAFDTKGPSRPTYSVSSAFWNYQKLTMMNRLQQDIQGNRALYYTPYLGYSLEALEFDDSYFHGDKNYPTVSHNGDWFIFQDGSFDGKKLTGHDVNYYFEGMVAAAYGRFWGTTRAIVTAWRGLYGTLPTANELLAARQGYENYTADYQAWLNATDGGNTAAPLGLTPPAPLEVE